MSDGKNQKPNQKLRLFKKPKTATKTAVFFKHEPITEPKSYFEKPHMPNIMGHCLNDYILTTSQQATEYHTSSRAAKSSS